MLIVLLRYKADLPEIDRLMDQHVAFLEKGFEAGVFLAAGRRSPRTGGVILARGVERKELEAVMRQDPFVSTGAADFEVIDFRTSIYHPDFRLFRDPATRPHPGR